MFDGERTVEVGWIAGFLDGDGCFGWYGGNPAPIRGRKLEGHPCVIGCQKDPEPLQRIANTFSGGKLSSAWKPKTWGEPSLREYWEYRLINEPAIDLMVAVFPLMSTRRQEKIKEIFALYAEQAVSRIDVCLYCPQGHLRTEFGSVRKETKRNRRDIYCLQCNRDRRANHKAVANA